MIPLNDLSDEITLSLSDEFLIFLLYLNTFNHLTLVQNNLIISSTVLLIKLLVVKLIKIVY